MKRNCPYPFGSNFFHYLGRLIRRVGLCDGQLTAVWHQRDVKRVEILIKGRQSAGPTGGAAAPSLGYSLPELTELFKVRLNRLLGCLIFDYGAIEIAVANSDIVGCKFTVSARPNEGPTLDRLFRR